MIFKWPVKWTRPTCNGSNVVPALQKLMYLYSLRYSYSGMQDELRLESADRKQGGAGRRNRSLGCQ